MITHFSRGLIFCALWTALAASAAAEGFVEIRDGTYVLGRRMIRVPDGVVIKFSNGDVLIPKQQIAWSYVDGYEGVPPDTWTEEDKGQIAKGLAFYRGRWHSREDLRRALSRKHTKRTRNRERGVEERLRWKNRLLVKAEKHFTYEHTLDEARLQELDTYMLGFLEFVMSDLGVKSKRRAPVKVGLFHDDVTYREVMGKKKAGGGTVTLGFFGRRVPEHYYYDEPLHSETTYRHMRRGLTSHALFVWGGKFNYPQWVPVALGAYYGGMQWAPGKSGPYPTFQLPFMSDVREDLDAERAQTIEDIIDSGMGGLGAAQVPWAWSLVHFLLSHRTYGKKFRRFIRELPKTKTVVRYDVVQREDRRVADIKEQKRSFGRIVGKLSRVQKAWYQHILDYKQSRSAADLAMAAHLDSIRDDWESAENYARRALEAAAPTAHRLYLHARALVGLGRFGDALAQFKRAAVMAPLRAELYYWLARCSFEMRAPDAAGQEKRWLLLSREIEPWNEGLLHAVDAMFEARGKRRVERNK